jgi:hypothetical protein
MFKMTTYQNIIDKTPEALEVAIMAILWLHKGRTNAIGRDALVRALKDHWSQTAVHERQVREKIKELRREGYLIGSAPGTEGGYFLCESKEEYEEFKHMEFLAKIKDMNETMTAMDKAAVSQFGCAVQASLF